jgi:hypothetical protein
MNRESSPVERELVDAVSEGGTLLIKVQAIARKVEEQVWHAMEGHTPHPPHAQEALADGVGT